MNIQINVVLMFFLNNLFFYFFDYDENIYTEIS